MGCEQSIQKFCSNSKKPENFTDLENKSEANFSQIFINQEKIMHTYDKEDKENSTTYHSNLSDLRSNLHLDSKIHENIKLNIEKAKIHPLHSDKDNMSFSHSETKDAVEQISSSSRKGKSFICLIKEFNFVYKLFYSKLKNVEYTYESNLFSPFKENKENSSFLSNYNSVSSSKNCSLNEFTLNNNFQKQNEKSKLKEIFQKIKNLIYIPVISISGEVRNSFIFSTSSQIENKIINPSQNFLECYCVKIPNSENLINYILNFLQNLHKNLNISNLVNDLNYTQTLKNSTINSEDKLFFIFKIAKFLGINDIKLNFDFFNNLFSISLINLFQTNKEISFLLENCKIEKSLKSKIKKFVSENNIFISEFNYAILIDSNSQESSTEVYDLIFSKNKNINNSEKVDIKSLLLLLDREKSEKIIKNNLLLNFIDNFLNKNNAKIPKIFIKIKSQTITSFGFIIEFNSNSYSNPPEFIKTSKSLSISHEILTYNISDLSSKELEKENNYILSFEYTTV